MGWGKFLKFWGGGECKEIKILQNFSKFRGGGNDQGLRGEFRPSPPHTPTPGSARGG